MGDAEIIPIGTRGRPGRGTGKPRPSAAARSLAPGQPAAAPTPPAAPTGSAATPRKRPPPPRRPKSARADAPSGTTPSETTRSGRTQSASTDRPATTTTPRGLTPGIPVEDWLAAVVAGAREVFGEDWEQRLARMLAVVRRRLSGDYTVDEYGFDAELTEHLVLAVLRPLAQKWFRIEVHGIENIPAEGGALVVSNHSGTLPMDALMTMSVVHDQTGRFLRPLGADLVFNLPVVSAIARQTGATLACHEDAERMLRGGELVGVWPEGFKGIGKPFRERYRLQRFGRGGFVSAALRTGVPIIPMSVVGAEEIYPLIGNIPPLARLLGVPYVPVTPFFPWLGPLGMVPLPSKWLMEFGEPIRTDELDPGAADDPMLVFNVTDQVRETIQSTLYDLLRERESVFGFGR